MFNEISLFWAPQHSFGPNLARKYSLPEKEFSFAISCMDRKGHSHKKCANGSFSHEFSRDVSGGICVNYAERKRVRPKTPRNKQENRTHFRAVRSTHITTVKSFISVG